MMNLIVKVLPTLQSPNSQQLSLFFHKEQEHFFFRPNNGCT